MRDGINGKVMKIKNALLVLEMIMERSPISRSALTRLKLYKGAEHKNAAQKPEVWNRD